MRTRTSLLCGLSSAGAPTMLVRTRARFPVWSANEGTELLAKYVEAEAIAAD